MQRIHPGAIARRRSRHLARIVRQDKTIELPAAVLAKPIEMLLGRHRDVATRLRADKTLVAPFVEEALRLESPFRGHYRHVVHDTTLDDIALPAGSHLYLAWGGANRDPHRFEDPDTIILDPAIRPSHMAFGKGIHLCVGAALARLETRICIEFLLDAAGEFTLSDPTPQWTRSLLSRRLHTLPLTVHPA